MTPIGMGEADVIITNDVRPRLAVGYTTPFDDRPWIPEHGWAPSAWFESATADGTICASAEHLTAFARLLLSGGRGILSPESFARMTARVAEDPDAPGHVFGYGVKWVDGDRLLGHSGGMIGFTAYLLVDVGSGFGTTMVMNSAFGDHRLELARFALACLSAEAVGDRVPEVPDPPVREEPTVAAPLDGDGPEGWESLAGRYRSWNPWWPFLEVRAHGGKLWIWTPNDALDRCVDELELVPLPDGRYRLGEGWSPDRVAFDTFVGDRAIRISVDGAPFTRVVA
jgi:CubicO group peptidase (beta-lactamase class C family)